MTELELDNLAALGESDPWATHVFAAVISWGTDVPRIEWPAAPDPVVVLASAVAQSSNWRMYDHRHREWWLTLSHEEPCPQLSKGAFTLARCEAECGLAIAWRELRGIEVHAFDDEGSTAGARGSLGSWCRSRLYELNADYDEYDERALWPDDGCKPLAASALAAIRDRRRELASALAREVSALEAKAESDDAVMAAWMEAYGRAEAMAEPPWGHAFDWA